MNRRDILKSVAAIPLVALFGRQDASATPEIHAYRVPTSRTFGITGSYRENHHWTGDNGEHMKVEQLARIGDYQEYFFAAYPKDITAGQKVYYSRFAMSGEIYHGYPEMAQHLYEKCVADSLAGYYAQDWSRHDPTLSIEYDTGA